jgi:putative heme-binding domain-containing protein
MSEQISHPASFARLCLVIASLWGAAAVAAMHGVACAHEPPPINLDRPAGSVFRRDNLIAWCIVPFDAKKRSPEERAAMLKRLGFKHFAYDWRAEHIPTFDAEMEALKRHGIALDAFWLAPGELNGQSRMILDLLKRHGIKTQLWAVLDLGNADASRSEQNDKVEQAAAKLQPLAAEAGKIGCTIALYNHGGWFGEPENQIAIVERLKAAGAQNVGMVYNLHHGHEHLARFPALLQTMLPHLKALNLNGMDEDGDKIGRKILPLGQGRCDLGVLRTIRDSGYRGPIGILGHTNDDAEARLLDNLDGLDWLLPQLDGKAPRSAPKLRTPAPARPAEKSASATKEDAELAALVHAALKEGDAGRGADVFYDPRFACSSCHKVGNSGGIVGPELSTAGVSLPPEEIAESLLWPRKKIKEGYAAIAVATDDGKVIQGYPHKQTEKEIEITEATSGSTLRLARSRVEEVRQVGSLMPEGIAAAMSPRQIRDLVRFLAGLGKPGGSATRPMPLHPHAAAAFSFDRAPLQPENRPDWRQPVNRDRIYDYYTKEAEFFRNQSPTPLLLPPFPGLDGTAHGHWGNQSEETWIDGRWNEAELGSVLCGVFRGAGVTVDKGVCIRLGDHSELSACFNPQTLSFEALWRDGFIRFSPTRHGFLDGLILQGTPLERPQGRLPETPFVYRGFYRHGPRVVFAYRVADQEFLDSAWVENGTFTRRVVPASDETLARLTRGGPAQWPEEIRTRGTLGQGRLFAIDTIEPPFENRWHAPLFFGDLDFMPDGSAMLCTMQGDVWHVMGIDAGLRQVRWRRFASGLHQALGLVVADGLVHVLGRDQITRLHDLNRDGEADFYECVSNAHETSPAGHDFVSGLQRDAAGNFYTVSSKQGLLKIPPGGRTLEIVATGFRNPDGLGLTSGGVVTVPNSEGEWIPASMICEVRPGGFYGYGGPRDGRPPDLPLLYLPRGLDNSSAAQVEVTSERWQLLLGQLLHFSYGAGTYFLVLRDQVDAQPQGAAVPLPGEFLSGVHRGRFNRADGQLYVAGMGGWGTYTAKDGCFQRVRYTGEAVQIPLAWHAAENGVLLSFSMPLDRAVAEQPRSHFVQAWNYRYSSGYGSPELSPRHPGMPGHDPLSVASAHVLADGKTLFLEMPEIQPVNQLHLHLRVDAGPAQDLFATVHKLAAPFTGFPGYRVAAKTIAAHPILADMAALNAPKVPNPWRKSIRGAREIHLAAGSNLTFSPAAFRVKAGEAIKLTFSNPDAVPHNWALARPGTLSKVGDLVNKIIAEPDAAARHYIPTTDDILVYMDIINPGTDFTISFTAPEAKGRYPYLCTFPGHWMVMNGIMTVE